MMTIKTLLTAAALAVTPALAMATCPSKQEVTMTCAAGQMYDAATNSCKVVSG
ncbi:carbohydrate-binding module family 14 protein [Salipiger sp. P9]|uniref:carbohydrate-binding module family 14 protein n=1 Tax=Salipiger pentaromativorans TaxID=2943193 RepID=UPI002157BD06|nr:carbohydrate-binding module family 14 protein [Salipiger pentaromativorans]MCR8546325.1 carbohydrate-binding module family 14 protein [Salipiger pentaromativorans]